MKNTHTPGPWRWENNTLTGSNDCFVDKDEELDAALIASAPDLLSALEQAYNAIAWNIPGGTLSDEEEEALLDTIRASIAKAKGEA